MERDEKLSHLLHIDAGISTHTLTWSVTTARKTADKISTDFNSHAHVERDAGSEQRHTGQTNFNSHAHVERDSGYVERC